MTYIPQQPINNIITLFWFVAFRPRNALLLTRL